MSRADQHARDMAQFLYFEKSTTQFDGETIQEALDNTPHKLDGIHTGNTILNFITVGAGITLEDGILRIQEDASLNVDGDIFSIGDNQFDGDSRFGTVTINGDFTINGDTDFTDTTVDFSSATVLGLATQAVVLPAWTQAYKYSGSPSSAPNNIFINRATLEGKELLVTVYDQNNVDEMGVIMAYFPNIGANMPSDHAVTLGFVHNAGGTNYIEYNQGRLRGNGMRVLLVLYRDPVVAPVGGISFDSNTAIQWSNTI
jgi:hypothetical protein